MNNDIKNLYIAIKGRHEIPFSDKYILDEVKDPSDIKAISKEVSASFDKIEKDLDKNESLNVIVTGLTTVTIAIINECIIREIHLKLWHMDMSKKDMLNNPEAKLQDCYMPQRVHTKVPLMEV